MNSKVIEKFKLSGKIAATALQHGAKMIKPSVKLVDVCDAVESKIKEMGGDMAFPAQTSINEVAAHYCPEEDDETTYKEGDVVKLDCGVHIDGYVSDNATTVDLGNNKELVKASRDAVNAAIKIIKPGVKLLEIGRTIQKAIENLGFSPIKNLSGHGIGRFIIHSSPSIPNFDNGNNHALEEGQSIAIEPFASTGAGMIYEGSNPTVFMIVAKKPVRSLFARQILQDLQQYNGLPFTTRWLSRKHGIGKTKLAIRELLKAGIIRGYPKLPDVKKGFVSQAEHSVLVFDKPIVITKLE